MSAFDELGIDPAILTQIAQAQALRQSKGRDTLTAANNAASRYDKLAAIAAMSGDENIASAGAMAAKNAAARNKPISLGTSGFATQTGDFIASPMYEEQKAADRATKLAAAAEADRRARELQADRLENQNSQRALDRTLRSTLAALAGDKKSSGEDLKQQKATDQQISKYSLALDKDGVPELDAGLELVQANLSKYKDGELPGYGRALTMIPTGMLPDEAQGVRTDMADAANRVLRAASGLAVTEPEHRRFLQQVGAGVGMSEATLRKGWANVAADFEAKKRNLSTILTPELHDEYIGRGGKDYRPKAAPAEKEDLSWLPPGAKIISKRPK